VPGLFLLTSIQNRKAMSGHCKMILENNKGDFAFNHDKFEKLITASRTAVDNNGALDKESIFVLIL
jgi:hypothetical protein